MRDELDKGLAHELGTLGIRGQDVLQAVDGEAASQLHDIHQLLGGLLAPEARQSVVPNGGQQLLDIWMCHKLEGGVIFINSSRVLRSVSIYKAIKSQLVCGLG